MTTALEALQTIHDDLRRGTAKSAYLGEPASEKDALQLDQANDLIKYVDRMELRISRALHNQKRIEWIIVACLLILFVAAIGVTIVAQAKGWEWPQVATIPGLGITGYGAVRALIRIRRENLALLLMPSLIRVIPPGKAAPLVETMLSVLKGRQD